MNRVLSAHMTDVKGKGICYDNDDEPIQLTDQDDSHTIRDYRLSLIGKILNPKKQLVEKLIQTMPAQWEMQDKITANDLGWETVVHDDYPWFIPFWVEITGIPLHLWTIKNLRNIGNKLGLVDTIELEGGRMLIDVDTRKPLTFIRKIASPEGDEVSIQIHYEKLFKNCKTCGMVTHELAYFPTKEPTLRSQGERPYEKKKQQPQAGDIGGPPTQQSAGLMVQDTEQSSGKRIASLTVNPSRHAHDDNVTKRPRVSPRLITFSPTEEVLPVDAQVIGALNDMEITSNRAERLHNTVMVEGDNEDDLLGEDLMDMEADIV
ncbi:uncharacterized protein LOC106404122 [Brassica napus]|uniref:uncharacterized protein LOC106404122 n=1 Tax=Brassica napus TaxID=3708 RepID=UPI0006AB5988|nr:uncharacterized protein LOC106404122 [Brassica napus]